MSMAESVHKESLDEDNRRFVPDEVFETVEEAEKTPEFLMSVYENGNGPLVYPILLKDGTYIGYVQAVAFDDGTWEVGYHIGIKRFLFLEKIRQIDIHISIKFPYFGKICLKCVNIFFVLRDISIFFTQTNN